MPNQLELALVVDGEFHRVTVPKVEPSPFRERVVKRVVRPECEPKVPEVHHAWHVPYYDIEDHRCGGRRSEPECVSAEYDLAHML